MFSPIIAIVEDSPSWAFLLPEETTEEVVVELEASCPPRRRRRGATVPYAFTPASDAGEAKFAAVPVVGRGVRVAPSTIAGGGNGLYADRLFEKGELITEYAGQILDRETVQLRCQLGQFQYIGTLKPQQYYIDGIREPVTGMGGASFVNHSARPNACWVELEDRRLCFARKFAKATRRIAPGEEVFINYGRTYWTRMRRWHDMIASRGLENISDYEGDDLGSDESFDYVDFAPHPAEPSARTRGVHTF